MKREGVRCWPRALLCRPGEIGSAGETGRDWLTRGADARKKWAGFVWASVELELWGTVEFPFFEGF